MNRSFSHTAQIVLCTGVALGSVQEFSDGAILLQWSHD